MDRALSSSSVRNLLSGRICTRDQPQINCCCCRFCSCRHTTGSQYAGVGAYFLITRQKKLKSSISSKEMIRSKLISNLIGHFTSVSESMPTLTLLSLFRCLSHAAHRCQNPGIIPHFLLCPFYFSTEKKTAFSWRCRQYRSVH